MMCPVFDAAMERTRFLARSPLLQRADGLRLELIPGLVFQPETGESVEDQVIETLWAEGKTLGSIDPAEQAEVRASFAVLTPRREPGGHSVAASLLLGFPAPERDLKMAQLRGLPEQLWLELESGSLVAPEVDRGAAGPEDRLPAVLALRYFIPDGVRIAALVSNHAEVHGRWAAATAWSTWTA